MRNWLCPGLIRTTPTRREARGFTLIELLVVIAIIAILAAILFPVFAKARENARKTSCLSNLKQLELGFMQYTQDFDESYPGTAPFDAQARYGGYLGNWVSANGTAISATNPCNVTIGAIYPYTKSAALYQCPSDANAKTKLLSYSMNNSMGFSGSPPTPCALSSITSPSLTVMLVDEGLGLNDGNFSSLSDSPSAIHLGGANLGYVDGHAKWQNQSNFNQTEFAINQ